MTKYVLCFVLVLPLIAWANRQTHSVVTRGGVRVNIEYPNGRDITSYGVGQHILVLREALEILESIAADQDKKNAAKK